MSRLDGVTYSDDNKQIRDEGFAHFLAIEAIADAHIVQSRAKNQFFVELENCYTWYAKAIRDQQFIQNSKAAKLLNPPAPRPRRLPVKRRNASDAVVIERKKRI